MDLTAFPPDILSAPTTSTFTILAASLGASVILSIFVHGVHRTLQRCRAKALLPIYKPSDEKHEHALIESSPEGSEAQHLAVMNVPPFAWQADAGMLPPSGWGGGSNAPYYGGGGMMPMWGGGGMNGEPPVQPSPQYLPPGPMPGGGMGMGMMGGIGGMGMMGGMPYGGGIGGMGMMGPGMSMGMPMGVGMGQPVGFHA